MLKCQVVGVGEGVVFYCGFMKYSNCYHIFDKDMLKLM